MHKIIIHSQDHLRVICQTDIMYCKSNNSYTAVHLAGEKSEVLIICKSLAKFSNELDKEKFVRINQSYLINKHFIKSINKKKKHIELNNTESVPFTISLKALLDLISDIAR